LERGDDATPLPNQRQGRFAQLRSLGLPTLEAAREAGYADISRDNARKLANRAFLVRMLFSCLVDADFLETERPNASTPMRKASGWSAVATSNLTVHKGFDSRT
jgi:hypothetical protein